jgi:hypothetical protein
VVLVLGLVSELRGLPLVMVQLAPPVKAELSKALPLVGPSPLKAEDWLRALGLVQDLARGLSPARNQVLMWDQIRRDART